MKLLNLITKKSITKNRSMKDGVVVETSDNSSLSKSVIICHEIDGKFYKNGKEITNVKRVMKDIR